MNQYIYGNVLEVEDRPLMIAHVVNDAGLFGAGFAHQVRKRYPWAYEDYMQSPMRRGDVRVSEQDGLFIAHLCAMNGVRSRRNPKPLDMTALARCLDTLCREATRLGFDSVSMPKIGAGLAGGNWANIALIIYSTFEKHNKTAIVYELGA